MNTEEAATVLQIASTLDESEDKNLMTVATILRGMLGEIQRLGTESDKLRADLAARDAEIAKMQEQFRDYVERSESDAIDLRKEIADLKRGGVVVPEIPELSEEPVVVEDFADNGAHSQWRLVDRSTGETLWEEATRTIPADRELGEGDRVVGREEWMYLAALERYARKHGPESIQGVIECLDHLRAQPTQEPTT